MLACASLFALIAFSRRGDRAGNAFSPAWGLRFDRDLRALFRRFASGARRRRVVADAFLRLEPARQRESDRAAFLVRPPDLSAGSLRSAALYQLSFAARVLDASRVRRGAALPRVDDVYDGPALCRRLDRLHPGRLRVWTRRHRGGRTAHVRSLRARPRSVFAFWFCSSPARRTGAHYLAIPTRTTPNSTA